MHNPLGRVAIAMPSVTLHFHSKPPRDYVHGPDLFNAVQQLISSSCTDPVGRLDVDFHSLVRRQCMACIRTGQPEKAPSNACLAFRFRSDTEECHGWFSEDDRALDEGAVYNEAVLVSDMIHEDKSTILFSGHSDYSAAEVAVAATKELHLRLFADAGQWIVSRFSTFRPWPERLGDARVRCKLVSNLHNRLTRTEISIAEEPVGALSFSAIRTS
jgi:hypothetical protein